MPFHRRAALAPILVLIALSVGCKEEKTEETAPPLDTLAHDTVDYCPPGVPPVISEVLVENGGLADFDGETLPTVLVSAVVSDEDGDISSYKLDIWYDDTVDGSVEQGSTNTFQGLGTLKDGECTAPAGTVGLQVGLSPDATIAFNTLYEWGAIVTDDNLLSSEMVTGSGYTPTESGEDGGP